MVITDNFVIEDLGIMEELVYDLEVKNTHNFFGNDILLHNSNYYSLSSIKHLIFDENDDIQTKVNKMDNFIQSVVDPAIKKINDEYARIHNAYDGKQINAEREAIADSGVLVAKKRYFLRVYDMEGVRYDEPYMKKMGIELIKSSTPKFSKKYLNESLNIILDGNNNDLINWLGNVKALFTNANIIDISKTSSVNKINYTQNDIIPINSRAAMVYNNYIKNNKLDDQFSYIQAGDKIKMVYLKEPNIFKSNIIGFNSSNFIENYRQYIDWDTNWEKHFLKPLEIMIQAMDYKLKNVTKDTLDDW